MDIKNYSASDACRDAFALLQGAVEISYKDGDKWRLEDGQDEHPLVHKLRAHSRQALTEEPPPATTPVTESELLSNERTANAALRGFMGKLQELCEQHGCANAHDPDAVYAFLAQKLRGAS